MEKKEAGDFYLPTQQKYPKAGKRKKGFRIQTRKTNLRNTGIWIQPKA